MNSVDAITDPPNSTVNYLATTASSGDSQLFADQVSNVQMLTATLQEVAHNATMGSVTESTTSAGITNLLLQVFGSRVDQVSDSHSSQD